MIRRKHTIDDDIRMVEVNGLNEAEALSVTMDHCSLQQLSHTIKNLDMGGKYGFEEEGNNSVGDFLGDCYKD